MRNHDDLITPETGTDISCRRDFLPRRSFSRDEQPVWKIFPVLPRRIKSTANNYDTRCRPKTVARRQLKRGRLVWVARERQKEREREKEREKETYYTDDKNILLEPSLFLPPSFCFLPPIPFILSLSLSFFFIYPWPFQRIISCAKLLVPGVFSFRRAADRRSIYSKGTPVQCVDSRVSPSPETKFIFPVNQFLLLRLPPK